MKLVTKLLIIIAISATLINAFTDDKAKDAKDLKNNQKEAFPNQWESATNKTNLEKAAVNHPLLSRVLFEEDPKRKLSKGEFVSALRFGAYKLTKGESERIFEFADTTKTDLLNHDDWETFTQLYIAPYEACDKDGDFLLNDEEFKVCFEKDPKASSIQFRRSVQDKKHTLVMWAVTSRAKSLINFHDYLLIRRALYGWVSCHANSKFISKNVFKCAMKTAVSHKINFHDQLDNIYDVGLKLTTDGTLIQMDFIGYMRIIYDLYVFTSFGHPMNMPYIEKTQFLKAIKDDKLPSNFDEKEVNLLFNLVNTSPLKPADMNFESFAFFFNIKKLFNRYSSEKPNLLSKAEMMKLLADPFAPSNVVGAIDAANAKLSEAEFLEASLILKRKRVNEDRFFFSFLQQDASENSATLWNNSTNATSSENKEARETFFSSFSSSKDFTDKEGVYRSFQLANFFTTFGNVASASVIVDNLMGKYSTVNPPLSIVQRANFPTYKAFPRDLNIDVLSFLVVEGWRYKMREALSANHLLVNENMARMVLSDFGMENMPDSVLDLSKKGFDNLRVRTFEPVELMSNCAVVLAAASENKRRVGAIKGHRLRHQLDLGRKFPNNLRRTQASPYA